MGKEEEILEELVRIRKLLILQLVSQGNTPTAIGKALGITSAKDVRKLVPMKGRGRKRTAKNKNA